MKFYVVKSTMGEVIGCELSRKEAKRYAETIGWQPHEIEVEALEVAVNADTVRRLLGNLGGYVSG